MCVAVATSSKTSNNTGNISNQTVLMVNGHENQLLLLWRSNDMSNDGNIVKMTSQTIQTNLVVGAGTENDQWWAGN